MSRESYRATWGDSLVAWIHVRLDESADKNAVSRAISAGLGRSHRLRILTSAEMIDDFARQVRQAFSLQYIAEAITFLLVLIGIGDTLAAGVVARTREFGMIRAVGIRRARLFQGVMLEGAAIGVLGLLLALGLGLALGFFWIEVQFPAILGWELDVHFPWRFAATSAVLTLFVCLTASVLPSFRAARLPVPQALRNE
jgi:putative ABC transport system permease protein